MNYFQELKNPIWQKKRLSILERDNWTCQGCYNKEQTLHVHHITYEKGKKPWDYEDGNFITLCEDCHKRVHEVVKLNAVEFYHAAIENCISINIEINKNEPRVDGFISVKMPVSDFDLLNEIDKFVYEYKTKCYNEKMQFVVKHVNNFIFT
jgi:hypothetical protein